MKVSARVVCLFISVFFVAYPCRAAISVNWLDEPIVLYTDLSTYYEPLDLNGDSIVDFTFGVAIGFVGVRSESVNQYLLYPSPPPNIGGDIEPLSDGFEIGPNSGSGELDWFNHPSAFAPLIICLSGSGGYTCVGRFKGHHAYMGVEFDIAGATHYGWIDLHVAEYSPGAEIYGWAYETEPGVSIIAGAVPEPATILLLLGGVLAVVVSRRPWSIT